jgi:hypothetical protein
MRQFLRNMASNFQLLSRSIKPLLGTRHADESSVLVPENQGEEQLL